MAFPACDGRAMKRGQKRGQKRDRSGQRGGVGGLALQLQANAEPYAEGSVSRNNVYVAIYVVAMVGLSVWAVWRDFCVSSTLLGAW
jgi:hypothetical protein